MNEIQFSPFGVQFTAVKHYFLHQLFSKNVSSAEEGKVLFRVCDRGNWPSGKVRAISLRKC